MHRRSKFALLRLRKHTQIRSAATATKPAPQLASKWQPERPAAALPPKLDKWARQDPLVPPSSALPSSKWGAGNLLNRPPPTPASSNTGRWARKPSSSVPSLDEWTRPSQPKPLPSSSKLGKWTQDPSTSDSSGTHARARETVTSSKAPTHLDRDVAPHLQMSPQQLDSQRAPSFNRRTIPSRFQDSASPRQTQESTEKGDTPIIPKAQNHLRAHEGFDGRGKRPKIMYKERGSLSLALEDETFSRHYQDRSDSQQVKVKKKKNKKVQLKQIKRDVFIPTTVSVGNLARLLGVSLNTLHRKMHEAGMSAEASYDHVLTSEYSVLLAQEFNRNPVINDAAAFDIYPSPPHPNPSSLPLKPPVVAVMGHVDHGKTTLLDTLRSSSVAAGEAGGITQHIGAFSVPLSNSAGGDGLRAITFLDTPGHAAFSAMRARGAGVTDIVVLVVAADDGVMPQTKEVIELARKEQGKVQLVVAINKIDKPGIDISKVHNALLTEGVQLEAVGGDIPSVEVSGLTGKGLDELLETIATVAEMQDLRAERDCNAHGHILESKVQKGLGPTATVLLTRGCLKAGSHIICGTTFARVRAMTDSSGQAVKVAYPGMAVTVAGWKELPNAGDEVLQGTEQDIKKAVTNRERQAEQDATLIDLEAINSHRRLEREQKEMEAEAEASGQELTVKSVPEGPEELRIVIKGDVSGSIEAVAGAVEGIGNDKARVKIISTGVGEVSESDILRAKAAQGMVIAFSVPVPRTAANAASSNNIPIYSSSIIYEVMDEVQRRVIDLLPSVTERRVKGEATVLQLFEIQLSGKRIKKIAGSRVTNGIVDKTKGAQVVRNGEVVHDGNLDTFRHLKKDITQAAKDMECGISIDGFDDLRVGDLIQVYDLVELPKTL